MSLLDDLREDLIADSLAAPAAKKPRNEWHEPTSWTLTGYVARCKSETCPRCLLSFESGMGIYSEESASNGTRRLTKASQWPTHLKQARMELVPSYMEGPCFNCMVQLGFTDVVDAPDIPTNIAGEGTHTTPAFRTSLSFTRKLGKDEE